MAKTSLKYVRRLQDIKTIAGKVDKLSHPHTAYLRISCLEMERARKIKEKESAMRRVAMIDERLKEIDAEKSQIKDILDRKEAAVRAADLASSSSRSPGGGEEDFDGFKIRY